eukprot:TRINITY_DN5523_c0_g3_i1.p1 TRINITY_DN5523_c0_g3~~TRINITY_DN5523_c0_g3_i1.p1  ORF type:complete len:345 (+),score=36.65 TRINITY_DN5523_c0_g3_i1:58-1035(+)
MGAKLTKSEIRCRRCTEYLLASPPGSIAVQQWCDRCRRKLQVSAKRYTCKPCKLALCHTCGDRAILDASGRRASTLSGTLSVSSSAQVDFDTDGMDEDNLCVICFAHPKGSRLEPCGHDSFCGSCSRKVRTCPLCCQLIQGRSLPTFDEARMISNEGRSLVDGTDRTTLHQAACEGNVGDVIMYLESGVSVDLQTGDGVTPLHHAVANGHSQVVQVLLSAGASVNCTDSSGNSPLHHASSHGYCEAARELIAHGALVNACDLQQMMPLHWAARMSHEAVAVVLLEAGAELNAKSGHGAGYTPFAMAEDWGTAAMASLLAERGGIR